MAEELLPCPHCNGPAEYQHVSGGYRVQCEHCGAEGGWGDYGYQAQESWNRRPSSQPLMGDWYAETMGEAADRILASLPAQGGEPVAWADKCRITRVVERLRKKAADLRKGDKPQMAEGLEEEADAVERILFAHPVPEQDGWRSALAKLEATHPRPWEVKWVPFGSPPDPVYGGGGIEGYEVESYRDANGRRIDVSSEDFGLFVAALFTAPPLPEQEAV